MNETAIFIVKQFDELKKNRRETDKIIENLSEKHLKWSHRIDKLENLVGRQKKNIHGVIAFIAWISRN